VKSQNILFISQIFWYWLLTQCFVIFHAFNCSAPAAWIQGASFGVCFKRVASFYHQQYLSRTSPLSIHCVWNSRIWHFYLNNTFLPWRNLWNLVFATLKPESMKLTYQFRRFLARTFITAMGFPVRTKGTGNTEHMFSQWGLVGTGNREQGTSQSRTKRDAPQGRRRLNFFWGGESLREQGTGNRKQGTCRVPQVFPEHVPEPLRENPSLVYSTLGFRSILKGWS